MHHWPLFAAVRSSDRDSPGWQCPGPAASAAPPESGILSAGLHQLWQLLRAEQWRQHPRRHREEWQLLPAGLVQLGELLHQEPLITMGFRFRRSARLGPLRFNFAKGGLSSISVGGRGASFNIPVSRSGGPRTTVGLPGTGLSWSVEHTSDRPAANPAAGCGRASSMPSSSRCLRFCAESCSLLVPPGIGCGSTAW